MAGTWIVYKTESMDAEGWEGRKLEPSGGLTDILAEEWGSPCALPQAGDRVRDYINLSDPGHGVTYGREGDWVVTRVKQFTSSEDDDRIVVCYCQYQPINAPWQTLRRGAAVDEMMASSQV